MRIGILFLIIIVFILNISALCEEGQIDINTASVEELDEIDYIGLVKAQEIINSRPFESIDDLIEVKGIGNWTLDKIKEQGLACVNGQEEEEEEIIEEEDKKTTKEENVVEEFQEIKEPVSRETGPVELPGINLNPQVIKSENDNENLSKSNYAIYGLVFFCVLLVVLFILRKNKYNKNEFR